MAVTHVSRSKMDVAKTLISIVGSLAAAVMVARTIANEILPPELHDYLHNIVSSTFTRFTSSSSDLTMVIPEIDGLENNRMFFNSVSLYLGSITKSSSSFATSNSSPSRLKITKPEAEPGFLLSVDHNQEIIDVFNNIKFKWVMICTIENQSSQVFRSEHRSFELTFHKKHKDSVIEFYFPHIMDQSKRAKEETKAIKLYTMEKSNRYGGELWDGINLNHPSTFETLAIDEGMKQMILNDLDRFVRRKEYYKRVGKAWKRGYLLYGPPGTGKSSLIAAMANYLRFDVYDLQLTSLNCNSELRKVLVGTANRSILVVEDIDCSIYLKNREEEEEDNQSKRQQKVTLSGLLNFMDGLWSSCGDERIIIFTTNYKEKLDPALMRPGRMDMHIHMSYCTSDGFKILARNYLGEKSKLLQRRGDLYEEIEKLIGEVRVTPAEVAEQLMRMHEPEFALEELIQFLQRLKKKKEEEKDNTKVEVEVL